MLSWLPVLCFKCWIVIFKDLTLCQVLSCVPVCLTLSAMGRSVLLCLLHHVPRVGLVLVCLTCLCVFNTDCQVLVCVLVVLTPSDNCWSV